HVGAESAQPDQARALAGDFAIGEAGPVRGGETVRLAHRARWSSFVRAANRGGPGAAGSIRPPGADLATVLQVIPALDAGGAERTTVEVAEALTRAGWRALVASDGGAMEGALAAAGGEPVRMRFPKNPVSILTNAGALGRLIAD